jgi:hypothetical protein
VGQFSVGVNNALVLGLPWQRLEQMQLITRV